MVFSLVMLSGCQSTGSNGKPLTTQEIVQKRDATLEMSKVGLAALIKQNPAIRKDIEAAPGYAVFNTTNVNVVLLVLARGEGVLFDKRRPEPIFMQAMKTGEGIGAGYQDQYQIILFKNTDAIDQFLFNPYITIYTVGLKGYDLQANYGGTLYLVDQQLNDARTLNNLPKKQK